MRDSTRVPESKKESTTELPMVDLEEAIGFALKIHEKGLETASLIEVAKSCGYAAPTSTPFYRRLGAARLFKLLSSPKAALTALAMDYFKPDTDGAKRKALNDAICGVNPYSELLNKNLGKRLNQELIRNSFAKTYGLTDACAIQCARVAIASFKFAGFIGSDGTVVSESPDSNIPLAKLSSAPQKASQDDNVEPPDQDHQAHTLYLDSARKRKITVRAPLSVTKAELERIRAWLGLQLIVEEPRASDSPVADATG